MGDDLCWVRSERLGQPRGHEYDRTAPDGCVWCAMAHEATALRTQLDEAVRLLREIENIGDNRDFAAIHTAVCAFLATTTRTPDGWVKCGLCGTESPNVLTLRDHACEEVT